MKYPGGERRLKKAKAFFRKSHVVSMAEHRFSRRRREAMLTLLR
jgi:hypothetical protein